MHPVVRRAGADDQSDITSMVRGARLNPRGLNWSRFVVAEDDGRLVAVGQVRELPRSVSRVYRIGRAVTAIASVAARRRIRIVPLERLAR